MRSSSATVDPGPLILTKPGRRRLEARLERLRRYVDELGERIRHGEDTEELLEEYRWRYGYVERLATILERARDVADVAEDPAIVEVGDEVVVECADGVVKTYALVYPIEDSSADARIPVTSPLGTALLGMRVGGRVTVYSPTGPYQCRVRARRRLA